LTNRKSFSQHLQELATANWELDINELDTSRLKRVIDIRRGYDTYIQYVYDLGSMEIRIDLLHPYLELKLIRSNGFLQRLIRPSLFGKDFSLTFEIVDKNGQKAMLDPATGISVYNKVLLISKYLLYEQVADRLFFYGRSPSNQRVYELLYRNRKRVDGISLKKYNLKGDSAPIYVMVENE